MNIGFYGDSFCSEERSPHSVLKGYDTYITKIKNKLDANIVHLGQGGSSIWDVALKQFDPDNAPDVSIFCWTDSSRLYNNKIRNLTYGSVTNKKLKTLKFSEIVHRQTVRAAKMYYSHLYDEDKHNLEYKAFLYYFDKVILPLADSKIIHLFCFENTYTWCTGVSIDTPLVTFADDNPYAANHINGNKANTQVANLILQKIFEDEKSI